jgi:hypothetical protein
VFRNYRDPVLRRAIGIIQRSIGVGLINRFELLLVWSGYIYHENAWMFDLERLEEWKNERREWLREQLEH